MLLFTPTSVTIPEDVPELTKKETLLIMKTSAVARTAVYQWNKMNTAVRILVHQTTVGHAQ